MIRKKDKQKKKDFDQRFDKGEAIIDFSSGRVTEGLSKVVKLSPLDIPSWVGLEIERIAQFQANSKSSVIRQLLVEAIENRKKRMAS